MKRRAWMLVVAAVGAACLAGAGAGTALAKPLVCESGCFFSSIQSAINAASPNSTITVGAGSYYENLTVAKPLTLRGAGVTTIVYPGVSKPVCSPGSLCGGEASNIVLVEASNVKIEGFWLKGDNPHLTSGVSVGGEDIDARNGIIENFNTGETYNALTVAKVKVTGVYLRGIYASSEGTFNFNHDTVENVQAEEQSIAMFNFGGSGVFSHDKVLNANDAISSNWSRGTQYLENTINKSGSGVHSDNNGGFGGTADVIKGNVVKECKTNGYGVFVFVPYVSATVEKNKVTGCSTGLAAYGGAVSGQGPSFIKNTASGSGAATTNNAGTYGVYLTTDQLGFSYGNLTATLEGNSVSHFNTGMFVTQSNPTEGQPAGGQATITATPDNSFEVNGTGAVGEPGSKVNARNDWWGCLNGPNKGGKCQTVTGTVEYAPWLTSHP